MNLSNETYLLSHGRLTTRHWLSLVSVRLQQLRAAWAERRQRARQLEELYHCTDRELWDLGISRSDFPAIRQGTYRRD